MWAAGDVKLLFVFSTIMPLQYFILNQNKIFPTFDALVNTFFLSVIYILIELFIFVTEIAFF